jgi:hypothetical protein
MRLRAAASALFPLAGEEKKSKVEAECHRLNRVALAARARQLQQAPTVGSSREYRVRVRRGVSHQPPEEARELQQLAVRQARLPNIRRFRHQHLASYLLVGVLAAVVINQPAMVVILTVIVGALPVDRRPR